MIALILFLLLGPPPFVTGEQPAPACAWWSKAEQRCRDEDMEVIGPWDPRPAPSEWDRNAYQSAPSDWGTYPTERQ